MPRLEFRDEGHFSVTILLAVLLIAPMAGAGGVWNEGPAEFRGGTALHAQAGNDGVALEWNPIEPGNWTRVAVNGVGGRSNHAMAYDSANGVSVLFGGRDENGLMNDTWTYRAATNTWTRRSPPVSPPARFGPAMAYDSANGVIVLFSGTTGATYFNDTWTYNTSANTWTKRNPALSPVGRSAHRLAYDSANGVVVLFGGYDGVFLDDTWTYETAANTWTKKSPGYGPSARSGHAMAYDSANGVTVLFGGLDSNFAATNDTWAYSVAVDTWFEKRPAQMMPITTSHAMAYDTARGVTVLFGGDPDRNQTWLYNTSTNSWTLMAQAQAPWGRRAQAMTYDAASGLVVMFGGRVGESLVPFSDTWTYDAGANIWAWRAESAPKMRSGSAMVYDRDRAVSVLFGGCCSVSTSAIGGTLAYDAGAKTWKNMAPPAGPAPRSGHAMAYDAAVHVTVLFGGADAGVPKNDTWTYSTASNTWTRSTTLQYPAARFLSAMAYDSANGVTVLFGGSSGVWPPMGDTWAYSAGSDSWAMKSSSGGPPARYGHAMAYDAANGVTVLFGGFSSSYLNDTWTYRTATNTWTKMNPPESPPARYAHAMAYNSAEGVVMLFGGSSGASTLDDTWTYNLSADAWTQRSPNPSPPARSIHAMAYDDANGVAVLFAGTGAAMLGDTWAYSFHKGHYQTGTYTSRPLDTGGKAYFGKLGWNSSLRPNTTVSLQMRSASSLEFLNTSQFTGPDGTKYSYYNWSGQPANPAHNGSRWVQYRAFLGAVNTAETPVLNSVSLPYNLIHAVSLSSPAGGESWNGVQNITWNASDPDNDTLSVSIYLVSNWTDVLVAGLPAGSGWWAWNTTGVPNGTYRIRIAVADDDADVPIVVEALSAEFTVFHPLPVNHPPAVTLVYPANNSILNTTNVTLQWSGSDPDGDAVSYYLYYRDAPFEVTGTTPPDATTGGTSYPLPALPDGATRYWTVIPYDGQIRGVGQYWNFSVNLSYGNHPPVFTSVPPAGATVGKVLEYAVSAVDEDGDALTYSLVTRVEGMTINATTGKLLWTPKASQKGNQTVKVRVTDGKGGTAEQSFVISVTEDEVPVVRPAVTIASPPNGTKAGKKITVFGTAAKGSAALQKVEVRVDGGGWVLASGTDEWTYALDTTGLKPGRHTIAVRAYDGRLYSDTSSVDIVVEDRGSTVAAPASMPWMSILSITAVIAVVATVAVGAIWWRRKRAPPEGSG